MEMYDPTDRSCSEELELKDVFPYKYVGGGYFRSTVIKKGETANILHGDQAIKFLFESMKKDLQN